MSHVFPGQGLARLDYHNPADASARHVLPTSVLSIEVGNLSRIVDNALVTATKPLSLILGEPARHRFPEPFDHCLASDPWEKSVVPRWRPLNNGVGRSSSRQAEHLGFHTCPFRGVHARKSDQRGLLRSCVRPVSKHRTSLAQHIDHRIHRQRVRRPRVTKSHHSACRLTVRTEHPMSAVQHS